MSHSAHLLERQNGDAPFTADPSVSYTMPARFYVSADIYDMEKEAIFYKTWHYAGHVSHCLLYTSPSPRDLSTSRMPSSA